MSNLTGGLTAGISYSSNSAMPKQSQSDPTTTWTARDALPLLGGQRVKNQPVPLQTQSLVGGEIAGLGSDIFNRIWVTPMLLAFGDIAIQDTDDIKAVRVWNAYPHDAQVLDTLNVVNDQDCEAVDITLPATIAPFGETVFSVVAGPFGKTTLDAYIPVTFANLGDVGNIIITGNRLENNLAVLQFTPAEVDFGVVPRAETVNQTVTIWNADPIHAMEVTRITVSDGAGCSISGIDLPVTIPALGTTTFIITALPEGADYIAAMVSVQSPTTGVTYQLGVYGTRTDGDVLPLVPNWSSPVNVTLAYSTDIITSRDGTEQRRALRQTPRRTVSFTALLYDTNGRAARTMLRKWSAGPTFLADPTRAASVTEGVPYDTDQLTLTALGSWIVAGAYVILVDGSYTRFRKVSSVDGYTVTFGDVSNVAWSSRTKVCACLTGRLAADPAIQMVTDSVATFSVVFQCDPGTESDSDEGSASDLYDAREIFPFTPQWSSPLTDTFTWTRESVDFGYGLTEFYLPTDFGVDIRQANILCDGNADDVVNMFRRMRGQQGEFFCTTFQDDMQVISLQAADGSQFTVNGSETYTYYYNDSPIGFIAVTLADGSVSYHKITSITLDGDNNSAITLDGPILSSGITVAGISNISWLTLSRFMTDTLNIAYLTDTVANVSLTVGSRPYVAAE